MTNQSTNRATAPTHRDATEAEGQPGRSASLYALVLRQDLRSKLKILGSFTVWRFRGGSGARLELALAGSATPRSQLLRDGRLVVTLGRDPRHLVGRDAGGGGHRRGGELRGQPFGTVRYRLVADRTVYPEDVRRR